MKTGYPLAAVMAGLVAALCLAPIATHALSRRDHATARLAELRDRVALAQAPRAPLVRAESAWRGADAGEAAAKIEARIRRSAAGQGVLVETSEAQPAPNGLSQIHLSLSGSERAVLTLSDDLVRQSPMLRFSSWRVESIAQGQVRLDAIMVAPWHA
ncbi:hypothetical protein [Stakelama pacifica]|uniref:Type II secretion system (T2SS) protein M subtype b n=1 Tax=Stakelama pacifica TaxID=517720 RepID=A0A4R6FCY0_9SPHN|nr:hypothetical protein [Stakelama pacifica]TDN79056.1 hypothetical protein EV664_11492 [Stakelama pacifica]GGO98731.1 hypothetical protein GCM10011329_30570 [Stakelama pacifica]